MKLIRKAKDERVVAEINRIYKVGFYFLTAGILADLVLQALGISVQNETIGGAVNLVEFAVVMLAQLFCLVLMARKGMMDDNAFAEADCYPWKHYLVQGALGGVAASVVVCVLQCATGAVWVGMGVPAILLVFAAQLLLTVPLTTVLVLLLTYASFRYAKRRRAGTEEE